MTKSKRGHTQPSGKKEAPSAKTDSKDTETQALMPSGSKVSPSPRHTAECHYSKPKDTPWWRNLLEIAAFLLGAYAVWVYKGQWDQARIANQLSLDNFRAGQRAWVGVDGFGINNLAPNSDVRVSVGIKNFGQTVALSTKYKLEVTVIADPEHPRQYPGVTAIDMIRPRQKILDLGWEEHTMPQGKIEMDTRELIPPLTVDQTNQLINRQAWLFGYGRITYMDIFGESHYTNFCAYLDLGGGSGGTWADCGGLTDMK